MERLAKIRTMVEAVIKKDKDYLSDPGFFVSEHAAGNVDDAFEMGVEQGYYDLAFSILTILDESEPPNDTNG